jgi:hypothetical protein
MPGSFPVNRPIGIGRIAPTSIEALANDIRIGLFDPAG